MQRAVQGQRGYGEAIDYRGQPVIAAWSYLPSFRWGMVVKQDVDEAFALINRQRKAIACAVGGDRLGRDGRRALAGADDHPADPRGRTGGRSGRLRRSHGHLRRPGARRGRPLAPGDPQDDPGPPLADRQDPAIEHHAVVDRDRDLGRFPAAGADRLRLQRLDQRGRRRRQRDLGHQPGAA